MIISRRGLTAIVAVLVLAGAVVVIWWLSRPTKSDEQQILEVFAQGERAVEDKNLSGVMRLVSEDYSDGTYNKQELKQIVLRGLRETRTIKVTPALRDLQIAGPTARADLEVDVWRDSNEPEPTLHISMRVELSKQKGKWLVTSAAGDWPAAAEQLESFE